jgi:hypothetical protein
MRLTDIHRLPPRVAGFTSRVMNFIARPCEQIARHRELVLRRGPEGRFCSPSRAIELAVASNPFRRARRYEQINSPCELLSDRQPCLGFLQSLLHEVL